MGRKKKTKRPAQGSGLLDGRPAKRSRTTDGEPVQLTLNVRTTMPFAPQHALTLHLQLTLESMCERFGQRWCSEVMTQNRWTVSRSLELTTWIRFIRDSPETFPAEAFDTFDPADLEKIFRQVSEIRHCAVHRVPQNNTWILQSLSSSHLFAKLHKDEGVIEHLKELESTSSKIVAELASQTEQITQELRLRIGEAETQNSDLVAAAGGRILNLLPRMTAMDEVSPATVSNVKISRDQCKKIFPAQSGWQLCRLDSPIKFVCQRCNSLKTSALVASMLTDWGHPVCNACYGLALAKSKR